MGTTLVCPDLKIREIEILSEIDFTKNSISRDIESRLTWALLFYVPV